MSDLDAARRLIADSILGFGDVISTVGHITLRPHQRAAASRLVSLVRANGGALLAEPAGLGKTYTSLAVARRFGGEALVVAPAALRRMWSEALAACGMSADFVSHEALSRGAAPVVRPSIVIVDEAHRARSASTQRYARLADLCRRSPVLLLSATPVQNRANDLAAQIALYAGRRAWTMSDDELASHVVRGVAQEASRDMPRQSGPHIVSLDCEDDCLDALLSLPAPVPAKDETIAVALLTYGLVHQWTSSRAALTAALRRRRTRGLALLAALDAGRMPTRAELSAWTHFDDAIQLAFPELVSSASDHEDHDDLTLAIDRHNAALEALLSRCRRSADPDVARAGALRRIREKHPGERIIAFCHYTETVNALRSHLSADSGIAALTAKGGRVAGGRLSREAILSQFSPHGPAVPAAERIDLLITTDVLSEGLNLQEASVVVHLDLPWNPARLDQRVGRIRRLGSRHATISVYWIAPPASAERLLRLEARLRDKLRVAQRTVGVAGQILPSPIALPDRKRALAECSGAIDEHLRGWSAFSPGQSSTTDVTVAAVESHLAGFLAVVRDAGGTRLVARLDAAVTDAPESIARAVEIANGRDASPRDTLRVVALGEIERYLNASRGSNAIDFSAAAAARSRRAALARVAQAVARTPRHRRAEIVQLADAARVAATSRFGEGAERILETLVGADLPDEAWLRAIAAFGDVNAQPVPRAVAGRPEIVALILFQPPAL